MDVNIDVGVTIVLDVPVTEEQILLFAQTDPVQVVPKQPAQIQGQSSSH